MLLMVEGPSCSDSKLDSFKYKEKIYARKVYASRCAFYKARNQCSHRNIKSKCSKTCAGTGTDLSAWSKSFNARLTKPQKYRSRCAYFKDIGRCKHRYYLARCSKTCSGSGADRKDWATSYVAHKAVVKSTKVHASRCLFWKVSELWLHEW